MPNQGPWAAATLGSADLLNASLLQSGTTAARPDASASNVGMKYWDTTVAELQRSNGAAWDTVVDSNGGAAVPSLRTLGIGASQAAVGNHTH